MKRLALFALILVFASCQRSHQPEPANPDICPWC